MDFTQPFECKCYCVPTARAALVPSSITRRGCTADDVVIAISYAGICHSDIHKARNEWEQVAGSSLFPMVPGHEIVGEVVAVGSNVTKFKVGDTAGVGCMVDSCRECPACKAGDENYCRKRSVLTYGSRHMYPHCAEYNEQGGNVTYGGYAHHIVVDEKYTLLVPKNLDVTQVAPLLCAGITTYSPLVHFGLRAGQKLAVVGLGGLGHMAVKFGVAMGAQVTVISRGTSKKESAQKDLGAHNYVDSTNAEELKAVAGSFDMIINTIAAKHDLGMFINLLSHDGKMVLLGAPPEKLEVNVFPLLVGRRAIAGSLIGGIRETQEMLDFCGQHNITCDVEVIGADKINEAYDRTMNGDVKYRFVIDVATI